MQVGYPGICGDDGYLGQDGLELPVRVAHGEHLNGGVVLHSCKDHLEVVVLHSGLAEQGNAQVAMDGLDEDGPRSRPCRH